MDLPFTAPFTAQQAAEAGVSPWSLRRWLDDGTVRRVLQGVYCPGTVADSLVVRAQCSALVLPAHSVIVERSAAWLHGIDLHDPDERFTVPRLEVISLRGNTRTRRDICFGATRDLQPRDITRLGVVPLTTPLRTALDLASLRGERGALAALDAFMRRFDIPRDQMLGELPRFRGRRGVIQLRRLVPLADPGAESQGESWLRATLIQLGFPPPETQIEVTHRSELLGRLDMGYRHLRIGVEYDGEDFHGPEHLLHDRHRLQRMQEDGWHVVVVRKDGLRQVETKPWQVELASVYAERSRLGVRRYPPAIRRT